VVLEKIRGIQEELNKLGETCRSAGFEVEAGLEGDPDIPSKFYVKFRVPQSKGVGEITESIKIQALYEDALKSRAFQKELPSRHPPLDQYVIYSSESTKELIEILREALLADSRSIAPEALCGALKLLILKDNALNISCIGDSWRNMVAAVKVLAEAGLHVRYEGWNSTKINRLAAVTDENVRRFVEIYGDKIREFMRSNPDFREEVKNTMLFYEVIWFEDLAKSFPDRVRLFYMLSTGTLLGDEDLKILGKILSRSNVEDRDAAKKLVLRYLSKVKDRRLEKFLAEDYITMLLRSKRSKGIIEAFTFLSKMPLSMSCEGADSHPLSKVARKLFGRDDIRFIGVTVRRRDHLEKKYLVFTFGSGTRVAFCDYDIYYEFHFSRELPLIGECKAEVNVKKEKAEKIFHKDPELLKKYALRFEDYAARLEGFLNEIVQQHSLAIKFMKISGIWPRIKLSKPRIYIYSQDDLGYFMKLFEERVEDSIKKFSESFEKLLGSQSRKSHSLTA